MHYCTYALCTSPGGIQRNVYQVSGSNVVSACSFEADYEADRQKQNFATRMGTKTQRLT